MLVPALMMRCLINLASNVWTCFITGVNQHSCLFLALW